MNSIMFPMVYLPRDRIVVVTGANTGIGYEIAKWAAMMGATVILACRSEERAKKAMERMQEEFQAEVAKGTKGLTDNPTLALEFMELNLSSFKSVLNFCEDYKKSGRPLHVLVCNAAVAFGTCKQTEDGYETILQVNYLGHFVLIAKLLLVMQRSGPDCRIVLLASIAHVKAVFNLATMKYSGDPKKYPAFDYYSNSKLYQIMQTFAMARRLKYWNVTVNCLHPGVVETDIWRPNEVFYMKAFVWMTRLFRVMWNSLQGAECAIDLVVNPDHAGVSGHYCEDCDIKQPSRLARDKKKQEALWKHTLVLLKDYLNDEEIASMEGQLSDKVSGTPSSCPV